MIQPLRRVHRGAFVVLALALPAILIAGLSSRHPRSTTSPAPMPASVHLLSKSDTLWQKHTIRSEFYGDASPPQHLTVVLTPAHDLIEPDVLVYWVNGGLPGDTLPAEARLLGTFATGKPLALPSSGSASGGHLLLYSLAHHAVVDTAALEKTP